MRMAIGMRRSRASRLSRRLFGPNSNRPIEPARATRRTWHKTSAGRLRTRMQMNRAAARVRLGTYRAAQGGPYAASRAAAMVRFSNYRAVQARIQRNRARARALLWAKGPAGGFKYYQKFGK